MENWEVVASGGGNYPITRDHCDCPICNGEREDEEDFDSSTILST